MRQDRLSGKIFTRDLLAYLAKLEDRPWDRWEKGKPLSPRSLGKLLREHFRITSSTQWIGGENSKGFARKDFADDWERYLPGPDSLSDNYPTGNPPSTAELPNKDAGPVALSDNAAI